VLQLEGDLKVAKPKTVLYGLWHVGAGTVRHARRVIFRLQRIWPKASALAAASPACGRCRCAADRTDVHASLAGRGHSACLAHSRYCLGSRPDRTEPPHPANSPATQRQARPTWPPSRLNHAPSPAQSASRKRGRRLVRFA
jgi:hypothetical protein